MRKLITPLLLVTLVLGGLFAVHRLEAWRYHRVCVETPRDGAHKQCLKGPAGWARQRCDAGVRPPGWVNAPGSTSACVKGWLAAGRK
jgi:hypothetical protein